VIHSQYPNRFTSIPFWGSIRWKKRTLFQCCQTQTLSYVTPNKDGATPERSNDYALLIGSLQYLAVATCPDITYAVNQQLAAYTMNPRFEHYGAAKCLRRYIKGTWSLGITYCAQSERSIGPIDSNFFFSFSDAAFVNANDRKSISSYIFLSSGGAITWGLKKQNTIIIGTNLSWEVTTHIW